MQCDVNPLILLLNMDSIPYKRCICNEYVHYYTTVIANPHYTTLKRRTETNEHIWCKFLRQSILTVSSGSDKKRQTNKQILYRFIQLRLSVYTFNLN